MSGWSRRALRSPFILLAAALAVATVGNAVSIAYDVQLFHHHYPGQPLGIVVVCIGTVSSLGIALAVGWIAMVVGRRD